MKTIADDLGFQMSDRGMHDYYFYNKSRSFDLLASAGGVSMYAGSSKIWEIEGSTTVNEVESKIRAYLYGK